MIRVRVDWHTRCLGCGTELVVDFLGEPADTFVCPWCGCACENSNDMENLEMRKYIVTQVKKIEDRANGRLPVKG